MFKHLRPVLYTENFSETINFYTEVLGFNLDEKDDENLWASVSKDNVGLMISKPVGNFENQKIGFSGSIYINVSNFDELWGKFKDKTKICYQIENFPWQMREFAIYDNNGYILQFGQNID